MIRSTWTVCSGWFWLEVNAGIDWEKYIAFFIAILDDTVGYPGPYQERARAMKAKTREIYAKTVPLMQKQTYWNYCKSRVSS